MNFFQIILLTLIRLYQKTISPDHSWLGRFFPFAGCRHYPSCSQYTYNAIKNKGVVMGSWMGAKRVLGCF
ncbi:MAG: membrane protein insertion efficiency factor YidD [Candidatus Portnoybacteria bacterium CG06_land_8_20_14_3_00_39_12]|uniref:Membrane protein insertion efficiency factor YidD n=3 Tax=Candidatus Portnoyibacteriota TaxID=1817913 RepID=A0A2M8KFC5_9BACT|nr:MAG: hypothetical protein AUJ33_01130 [Parcubacteria group bacterium CG1_02_40_25]PIU74781.1 MAG: membrane protein insertion efficiency factor YidD [Candidatus Portnoybacteria bacterium CG06_land_8_20_14_3_00_39_12]PIZ70352.1 MAG: membrane protein insertion efficiency factor YidD [Candidatus Portnoybacteria bacterium CG_4_10_14_0_2_um_filter_39_11]PJE58615.1 MAG: membrane protein insertion efficiency factor YidD [Candidatus Portnoybacteria bacterium CG10_big_fil_rev_8_21_14_0_10_40_22]